MIYPEQYADPTDFSKHDACDLKTVRASNPSGLFLQCLHSAGTPSRHRLVRSKVDSSPGVGY